MKYINRYPRGSVVFLAILLSVSSFLSLAVVTPARADVCGQYSFGGPPFLPEAVPPLVMLVMGRDHKLYYEAYNDASDLTGDGKLDIGYNPDIDYYGYFDSYKCYDYSSTNNRFEPQAFTEDKKCSGVSGGWSGDFLNYLTMSRMDTIRKVLYGGYRNVDSASETVLQRVFIPQDAHSWGKEYSADDGYNITDYTPLSQPMSGRRHFFVSTTLDSPSDPPLLRVLEDAGPWSGDHSMRIWNWVAIERPVAGNQLAGTKDGKGDTRRTIEELKANNQGYNLLPDFHVRVQACKPDLLEPNCKAYPGEPVEGGDPVAVYKPIGLLQKYGEGNSMYFGLTTGSYEKNMSGGVVRKNIGSITDEINLETGQFTEVNGIIQTIDKLRIVDFRYSDYSYEPGEPNWDNYDPNEPGAWLTSRSMNEGEFPDWGNPLAEMMYETLRYFADKTPTEDYLYSGGKDSALGLPLATWQDPFMQSGKNLYCAKPIMLVVSDINPSFDSDKIPGSAFATSGWGSGQTLGAGNFHAQNLADAIGTKESIAGYSWFVGENDEGTDFMCTAKTVGNLGSIRGLCPENPTKQGSYYAASVANYARNTDLRPDLTDEQKVSTFAVALSSPIPDIDVRVGNSSVRVVPMGKSISGNLNVNQNCAQKCTLSLDADGLHVSSCAANAFCPTNQIVNFFVDSITYNQNDEITYAKFRINFEDVEQGADHDMDAIILYKIESIGNNQIKVTVTSEYAAGGIDQVLGFIISGTTEDGAYLVVKDKDVTVGGDTPSQVSDLGLVWSKIFTVTGNPSGILRNPLWYAAKWGGYEEDADGSVNWDQSGDGVPDHYFFVANPLRLEQQLARAFQLMLTRIASGAAASVISSSRRGEGIITQAVFWPSKFDSFDKEVTWTGDVRALLVDTYGRLRDNQGKEVVYYYDADAKRTKACVDGDVSNGGCDGGTIKELDDLSYLWTVSEWLNDLTDELVNRGTYASNSAYRYIFTWNDANNNGKIDASEVIPFEHTNHESIPYLSESVIKWLRGEDQSGMRSRQYNNTTWRLGDVIHSSPVLVGAPAENYDLLWNDPTYGAFYRKYRDRRLMAYFGSNGGMLHAVNAGFYETGSGFVTKEGGPALGAEMWAYVPYNLLPHLSCLTHPNYSHQYYVDLRPRVFDVKIFPESTKHPGGWGTILVGGMRFGGGYVDDTALGREFSSSYFVLDITDPENPPVLLGETTTKKGNQACAGNKPCVNFGYTISVPTVVPVKDSSGVVKWFLVLSTGPDSDKISIESTQKAKVAVVPMEDYLGNQSHANWSNLRIPDFAPSVTQSGRKEVPNNNSFISTGMVSVDYDFDFFVDILYFGTTEKQGQTIGGGLQRLKVEGDADPSKWEYKSMFDAGRPVTGEPNVGWKDDNVWVYFGTGKFWTAADKFDVSTEAIYCIQEPKQTQSNAYNFSQVTKSSLLNVSNIQVSAETYGELVCSDGSTSCLPSGVTTFSGLQNEIMTRPNVDGAYRELSPAGERVLGQPSLLGGLLNFSAYHPDPDNDICASEGRSKLYSIHYLTCTPWVKNVFGEENTSTVGEENDEATVVEFMKDLGPGLTITPTLHLGDQEGATVFIQSSTGEIIAIDQPELPIDSTRSGRGSWHMIDVE